MGREGKGGRGWKWLLLMNLLEDLHESGGG